jgi:hypothetical protein
MRINIKEKKERKKESCSSFSRPPFFFYLIKPSHFGEILRKLRRDTSRNYSSTTRR